MGEASFVTLSLERECKQSSALLSIELVRCSAVRIVHCAKNARPIDQATEASKLGRAARFQPMPKASHREGHARPPRERKDSTAASPDFRFSTPKTSTRVGAFTDTIPLKKKNANSIRYPRAPYFLDTHHNKLVAKFWANARITLSQSIYLIEERKIQDNLRHEVDLTPPPASPKARISGTLTDQRNKSTMVSPHPPTRDRRSGEVLRLRMAAPSKFLASENKKYSQSGPRRSYLKEKSKIIGEHCVRSSLAQRRKKQKRTLSQNGQNLVSKIQQPPR